MKLDTVFFIFILIDKEPTDHQTEIYSAHLANSAERLVFLIQSRSHLLYVHRQQINNHMLLPLKFFKAQN